MARVASSFGERETDSKEIDWQFTHFSVLISAMSRKDLSHSSMPVHHNRTSPTARWERTRILYELGLCMHVYPQYQPPHFPPFHIPSPLPPIITLLSPSPLLSLNKKKNKKTPLQCPPPKKLTSPSPAPSPPSSSSPRAPYPPSSSAANSAFPPYSASTPAPRTRPAAVAAPKKKKKMMICVTRACTA